MQEELRKRRGEHLHFEPKVEWSSRSPSHSRSRECSVQCGRCCSTHNNGSRSCTLAAAFRQHPTSDSCDKEPQRHSLCSKA